MNRNEARRQVIHENRMHATQVDVLGMRAMRVFENRDSSAFDVMEAYMSYELAKAKRRISNTMGMFVRERPQQSMMTKPSLYDIIKSL